MAEDTLKTAGKPARLLLTTGLAAAHLTPGNIVPGTLPNPVLTPDWNDVTYATATLVDANGTVIPDSITVVHFATNGPGKIIAVDNGNLVDHDPFQATDRKLFEGHAIAVLRGTAPSGTVTLTATTEGVQPATVTLKASPAKPFTNQRSF